MKLTVSWDRSVDAWKLQLGKDKVKHFDTLLEVDAALWAIHATAQPFVTITVVDRTPSKTFAHWTVK